MADSARALEMMLGMTSSGIGRFDDLADQIVWIDDGYLAESDAEEVAFKRADEGMNPMEGYELPTLLPKRRNDHVLPGTPEKKAKIDAAVGNGVILPCDAQMWCRKVFPFLFNIDCESCTLALESPSVMRLLSMVIFVCGVCLNANNRGILVTTHHRIE